MGQWSMSWSSKAKENQEAIPNLLGFTSPMGKGTWKKKEKKIL